MKANKLLRKKLPLFISSLLLSTAGTLVQAYEGPNTDYSNDDQRFHIWNEALEPVELVNSILCFTAQMNVTDFINQGPYLALLNDSACFDNEGDDGDQSSGSANTPRFMEVVVDATRASDTQPLEVSVWIPGMEAGEDDDQAIKFKAVISEGASTENPFGRFTFNFEFFEDIDSTVSMGGGEVKTVNDVEGQIGFTLYESSPRNGFENSQSASVVMAADRTSGVALTASNYGPWGSAYGLAFNNSNVLVQRAENYDELGFRNGDASGQCLDRTRFDNVVWRYDVYDAVSGTRIEIDSGMPFKFDSDGDGSNDSYGHVGYWGIWTEQENALENGDSISTEDPATGAVTDYTVVKAPGRLIKLTVESMTLAEAAGIEFFYWDDSAYQQGFDSWSVQYLTVATDGVGGDGFYRIAGINWGEQGPERSPISASLLALNSNQTLELHSDQLGGGVRYTQGDTVLSFFREEYVNGSETGAQALFANDSVNLYCVDRCPVGTLGNTELADHDSPYSPGIDNINNAISYSIATNGANAMTLIREDNGQAVRYAAGISEQTLGDSANAWGVKSGAMVTADVLASLSNPWDIYNPEIVTEYYMWETGANDWNQLTAVRSVSGAIRAFDKPMQFIYQHSDANDRSGDAGDHAGEVIMLSYGGNGDLWGIPQEDGDQDHSFPVFNLADGTRLGAQDNYVVKAREIEGTMAEASGQCGSLSITEPAVAVPTSVTGSVDIGPMPQVNTAPAVVDGVTQGTD